MGHNDHDYEPDAPDEAFVEGSDPVEVDDDWLREASEDEQKLAMKSWFLGRFVDPAYETPYNGSEGGYLYIHGGPFDARDELEERFSGIASDEAIDALIDDLVSETGDEWAPLQHRDEMDFDPEFAMWIDGAPDASSKLAARLDQLRQVRTLDGAAQAKELADKLIYAAVVGALESFLWETVEAAVVRSDEDLRAVVKAVQAFREEKISLSEIFERHDAIKDHVRGYLQNLVWHRWDRVAPLLKALGVSPPSFRPLADAVRKRHDIVHRSGHAADGMPVALAEGEIDALIAAVESIADSINQQLVVRDFGEESAPEG
ncbi:MAG: hypothetical protein PSV40_02050 [Polaromonas sp.]|uniref:hypothetical protein n=1 Tax=Polaromonas sp. TaxID=1869339 RepID=UPI00248A3D22|nr:hypothetical protein [Polaromonas sp.]MDI1267871.1 hypothetical protein [Polaromonas sp.]